MTRSFLSILLGALGVVATAALPLACQSGGVGDPCTPEDEYNPQFAGFKVTEENIESRSFQCQTRICLVNHFQGRVSCPLGQAKRELCDGRANGDGDEKCKQLLGKGAECVEAGTLAPPCTVETQKKDCATFGGVCNKNGKFCECTSSSCPEGFFCDGKSKQCKSYVCHKPGSCQAAGGGDDNKGKGCCIPGTDVPVVPSVCGQCDEDSGRNGEDAVYCSCRCLRSFCTTGKGKGSPDGENGCDCSVDECEQEEGDPNFNYCDCPDGFVCSEIRKDVGISDPQLTGSYCIKQNTQFKSVDQCGDVEGYFSSDQCKGLGLGGT